MQNTRYLKFMEDIFFILINITPIIAFHYFKEPRDYKSPALTTELMARRGTKKYLIQYNILEIFIQWEVKISKTAICFT